MLGELFGGFRSPRHVPEQVEAKRKPHLKPVLLTQGFIGFIGFEGLRFTV